MAACAGHAHSKKDMSGAVRASQKSPSRSKHPGKRLVRVRGEAPALASDVRDLMQIHQREHGRVEHSQHLRYRWEANAAPILPQRHIAAPVEPIFHGPMRTNYL